MSLVARAVKKVFSSFVLYSTVDLFLFKINLTYYSNVARLIMARKTLLRVCLPEQLEFPMVIPFSNNQKTDTRPGQV